jgi:hypothetical protein
MSYGITGAPTTFQGTMNKILAKWLRKGVLVFIDDIRIYSSSWEQLLLLAREVFQALQQHQLKVKLSKCKFAQRKLAFLGHEISAEGVPTNSSNI